MLIYRIAPDGFYAAVEAAGRGLGRQGGEPAGEPKARVLYSDPFLTPPAQWELGREVDLPRAALLAPLVPCKIVGIGRNYREHARELDHEVPSEPLLFLKAPSSVIGPRAPVVLPPESARVDFEGEIAVVLRGRLRRAGREQAARAVLGVTCACDVTARDLQRRDATFARAKSFDTFCPLGPAILVEPDLGDLAVATRVNGEERQRGHVREMVFDILDLLVYTSAMMTLEPGDVLLTGTPAGVGPLAGGDRLEVEVSGVGVLSNPVEAWRGGSPDSDADR